MQKRKLTYRFHNPNTTEKTADVLIKLFVEVNRLKVEGVIHQAQKGSYMDVPEPILPAHT